MTRRDLVTRVGRAGGYGAAFSIMRSMGLLAAPPARPEVLRIAPGIGKGTKVAILGAGISGLVAAYEMGKAGFDCTVIEARDRPGGRNWSVRRGSKIEFTDGTSQLCDFEDGHYFNAGPARLPSTHQTMLGYCKELGVPLEVEVNTSRSTFLESDSAFGGRPIEQRQAINDTRGHVSELLAKAIQQGSLDRQVTAEDRERMLDFLETYGDLQPDHSYQGSLRSGAKQTAGAADQTQVTRDPLPMHALLDANFWRSLMFEESFDMQATMFQPVGGMDRIPYAFAQRLGSVVKYGCPVQEIRKTSNGVRIVYRERGVEQALEAAYCICALPLHIANKISSDFAPRVRSAFNQVKYDSAFKIAWESRRFWEQENNIYGGISWLTNPNIGLVWYPSARIFSEKGVVISGYSVEPPEFATLSIGQKLAASRAAVEKLHPGRGQELTKPMYVCWGKIPYNEGSWVSRGQGERENAEGAAYYNGPYKDFLVPDDRIFFAGDHCTHVIGWQEGAALSARRAINMIAEHMRQA
jgi:monoamine oxidase